MLNKTERMLLVEFDSKRELYEELEQAAYQRITSVIKRENFYVMDVAHRTKDTTSLENKIRKKSGKYKVLTDITDLCGIRIICYFHDTIDLLAKALREEFIIDETNSIDKRASLQATQFGYLSLHYICSFKEGYPYSGIPFEIQIRTVMQHAWAEIEHDLGYKSEFGVPRVIRRDFSRLAGLLEIADKEFVAVRDNAKRYTMDVRQKIMDGNTDDILIDMVSLNVYAEINKQFSEWIDSVVKETGINVEVSRADSYIEQLNWLGIESISDLSALLEANKDMATKMIKNRIEQYELDILSTGSFLRYLCRAELIRKQYSEDQIRRFISLSITDESRIERQLKMIMSVM